MVCNRRLLAVVPLVLAVAFPFLFEPQLALSQNLTVKPICGVAGSTISITGSGWAEPQPPCDYHFYFDGTEFAPSQPDGLFGPPNRSATIPAGATVGDHFIKTELRITATNQLL